MTNAAICSSCSRFHLVRSEGRDVCLGCGYGFKPARPSKRSKPKKPAKIKQEPHREPWWAR